MRKIYVLRDDEADGVLAGALVERGLEPDEREIENPRCPCCGETAILAAFIDNKHSLFFYSPDDEDRAEAEAWYLFCEDLECPYEEQVEMTSDPRRADIFFDATFSDHGVAERYPWLTGGSPAQKQEMLGILREYARHSPGKKVDAFRRVVKWHLAWKIKDIRNWLARVPAGRWIHLHANDQELEGRFLAATRKGLLMQVGEAGELVAVPASSLSRYSPSSFPPEEEPRVSVDQALKTGGWITFSGYWTQMVVVRGYHLELEVVSRVGMFEVRTRDRTAAEALGLEEKAPGYWEGRFTRAQIEARYDVQRMARVKGHEVMLIGKCARDGTLDIRSSDPQVAAALGLKPRYPVAAETNPTEPSHWDGFIPPELIEAEYDVRTYHWPLPEARGRDCGTGQ